MQVEEEAADAEGQQEAALAQAAAIGRAAAGPAMELLLRLLQHHRGVLQQHLQQGALRASLASLGVLLWRRSLQGKISMLC